MYLPSDAPLPDTDRLVSVRRALIFLVLAPLCLEAFRPVPLLLNQYSFIIRQASFPQIPRMLK